MYKKIRLLFLAISLLIFGNITYGQDKTNNEKLTKRVEVIKRYSPKIGSAIKHDIFPEAVTIVKLDSPKFDYSIAYTPQEYNPEIFALKSFQIATQQYNDIPNGYANIAVGYPLQSIADIYYTTSPKDNLFMGVGVNHYGFWSNLKNNMGDNVASKETRNSIFGAVDYKKHDFKLEADVKYSYNFYDMNGFYIPISTPQYTFANDKNAFHIVDVNLDLGTPYTLNDRWDWRFATNINYLSDNHNFYESFMSFEAVFAKGFDGGKLRVGVDVGFNYYTSKKGDLMAGYMDNYPKSDGMNLLITPSYRFVGDRSLFDFSVGFNIELKDKTGDIVNDVVVVTPNIRYELSSKWINGFIGVRSGYDYNTYNNLIEKNPYLMSGQTADNSYWGEFYLGAKGTILTFMTWQIEGGVRGHDNMIFFDNVLDGNTFTVDGKFKFFGFINTSVSAMLMDQLTAHIEYRYQSVNLYTYAQHLLDFGFVYQFTPKWQAKLNGELMSKREFRGVYNNPFETKLSPVENGPSYSYTHVPTKLYLSIGFEYSVSKTISITADINNVLNSKIYKFNNYRGAGINGMIGVTAKF